MESLNLQKTEASERSRHLPLVAQPGSEQREASRPPHFQVHRGGGPVGEDPNSTAHVTIGSGCKNAGQDKGQLHLLEGMAQKLRRLWGLLGKDAMSGTKVSYFPNLLGPSLDRGRMLTPDWLPTGLGSAVGKDKMPTCRLHVTLPWGSHLRHLIVVLGTHHCQTPWRSVLVPGLRLKPPDTPPHPAPLPSTLYPEPSTLEVGKLQLC